MQAKQYTDTNITGGCYDNQYSFSMFNVVYTIQQRRYRYPGSTFYETGMFKKMYLSKDLMTRSGLTIKVGSELEFFDDGKLKCVTLDSNRTDQFLITHKADTELELLQTAESGVRHSPKHGKTRLSRIKVCRIPSCTTSVT